MEIKPKLGEVWRMKHSEHHEKVLKIATLYILDVARLPLEIEVCLDMEHMNIF